MQSFLEYRKFGKAVQRQYERDKGKVVGARQNPVHDEKLDPTPPADRIIGNEQFQPPQLNAVRNTPSNDGIDTRDTQHEAQDAFATKDIEKGDQTPREPTIPLDDEKEKEDSDDGSDLDRELSQNPFPNDSGRMSRIQTARSAGSALGVALTGIHVRSRTTAEGKGSKVFVVGYEGDDDPLNPHNWGRGIRIWCTFMIAGVGFVVGVASAIDSSALPQASKEFGVSEVVESLATGKCAS